jgi:hypothetical protein
MGIGNLEEKYLGFGCELKRCHGNWRHTDVWRLEFLECWTRTINLQLWLVPRNPYVIRNAKLRSIGSLRFKFLRFWMSICSVSLHELTSYVATHSETFECYGFFSFPGFSRYHVSGFRKATVKHLHDFFFFFLVFVSLGGHT